ncbi:hypothetical protein, variant [Capsaspora owczarzaki ATCC 30864]|nr:hypothetical protein, variant [Capsaspora owczarzaki ATCC 30864]
MQEAWLLPPRLLDPAQSPETQFVGAIILREKIASQFSSLPRADLPAIHQVCLTSLLAAAAQSSRRLVLKLSSALASLVVQAAAADLLGGPLEDPILSTIAMIESARLQNAAETSQSHLCAIANFLLMIAEEYHKAILQSSARQRARAVLLQNVTAVLSTAIALYDPTLHQQLVYSGQLPASVSTQHFNPATLSAQLGPSSDNLRADAAAAMAAWIEYLPLVYSQRDPSSSTVLVIFDILLQALVDPVLLQAVMDHDDAASTLANSATDVISAVLASSPSDVGQQLLPRVASLAPTFASALAQPSEADTVIFLLTNILASLFHAHAGAFVRISTEEELSVCLALVHMLVGCVAIEGCFGRDETVSGAALEPLHDFLYELGDHSDASVQTAISMFAPVFSSLVHAALAKATIPLDFDSWQAQERMAWREHRVQLGELIARLMDVWRMPCLAQINSALVNAVNASLDPTPTDSRWVSVEAALFALKALAESVSSPEIEAAVLELLRQIASLPPLHFRVTFNTLSCFGAFAACVRKDGELLGKVLTTTVNSLADSRLVQAASTTLLRLCNEAGGSLVPWLDQLLDACLTLNQTLEAGDAARAQLHLQQRKQRAALQQHRASVAGSRSTQSTAIAKLRHVQQQHMDWIEVVTALCHVISWAPPDQLLGLTERLAGPCTARLQQLASQLGDESYLNAVLVDADMREALLDTISREFRCLARMCLHIDPAAARQSEEDDEMDGFVNVDGDDDSARLRLQNAYRQSQLQEQQQADEQQRQLRQQQFMQQSLQASQQGAQPVASLVAMTWPAVSAILTQLSRLAAAFKDSALDQEAVDQVVLAGCLALKNALRTVRGGLLEFVPVLVETIEQYHAMAPSAGFLDLACPLLAQFGVVENCLPSMALLVSRLGQTNLSLFATAGLDGHPTVLAGHFSLCASILGLPQLSAGAECWQVLSATFQLACQALPVVQLGNIDPIANFLEKTARASDRSPAVSQLLQEEGLNLTHQLFLSIGGAQPRGAWPLLGKVLFVLAKRLGQSFVQWAAQVLGIEGFPSPHVSEQQKRDFLQQIVRTSAQSTPKQFNSNVVDFGFLCCGFTAGASRTAVL